MSASRDTSHTTSAGAQSADADSSFAFGLPEAGPGGGCDTSSRSGNPVTGDRIGAWTRMGVAAAVAVS